MEIVPASDRALLVRLGAHERVVAMARVLERSRPPGVTSYSPAYDSVLVRYEPCVTDPDSLGRWLAEMAVKAPAPATGQREIILAVTFDGPDLDEISRMRQLRAIDVVEIFCATEYRVYFLGFVPGFAYMGDVDDRIAAPRRDTPRKSVPAGSVGIAGRQTGIYPLETPGGWNLIGRCAIPMFVADRHPPCVLQPGDRVRFQPA